MALLEMPAGGLSAIKRAAKKVLPAFAQKKIKRQLPPNRPMSSPLPVHNAGLPLVPNDDSISKSFS